MTKIKYKNIDYVFVLLLIAFTSFEYFYRSNLLMIFLSFFAGIIFINKKVKFSLNANILIIVLIYITYLLQFIAGYITYNMMLGILLYMFGVFFISYIVEQRFVKLFVGVMYYIAILSLFFYFISFDEDIKYFLMNNVAPYFLSLNVKEGTNNIEGINIAIYNFGSGSIYDGLNLMRNCGPFWEPGLFGVFLTIALFFNLFIEKSKFKYANIVFIVAVLTTLSTGAYVGLAAIFFIYSITRKNIIIKLISSVIFIVSINYMIFLPFLGEKITNQYKEARVGTDDSRFSAVLTQFEMIKDYPIIGGSDISNYSDTQGVASGVFYVFVLYGIPLGIIFYAFLFKSVVRFVKSYKPSDYKRIALLFMFLLFILAFSQTILTTYWFLTFLFVGLIRKIPKYATV